MSSSVSKEDRKVYELFGTIAKSERAVNQNGESEPETVWFNETSVRTYFEFEERFYDALDAIDEVRIGKGKPQLDYNTQKFLIALAFNEEAEFIAEPPLDMNNFYPEDAELIVYEALTKRTELAIPRPSESSWN